MQLPEKEKKIFEDVEFRGIFGISLTELNEKISLIKEKYNWIKNITDDDFEIQAYGDDDRSYLSLEFSKKVPNDNYESEMQEYRAFLRADNARFYEENIQRKNALENENARREYKKKSHEERLLKRYSKM